LVGLAEATAAKWMCRGLICIFSAVAMIEGAMCMVIVSADLQVVRRHTLEAAGIRAAVGESGEPCNLTDLINLQL